MKKKKRISQAARSQAAIKKHIPGAVESFVRKYEVLIICVLCLLAGARVFLFSAAFPFFNNVDEQLHLDTVCKYSQGHIPHGIEHISAESARLMVMNETLEYFSPPEVFPGGKFPPPLWRFSRKEISARFEYRFSRWLGMTNHECTQPPLYYSLAGGWYKLGKVIGLKGGQLLFWIKFLNIPICIFLVWLSYKFVKRFLSPDPYLLLGLPALVAFMPQDTFYAITNDVLTPLVFGAAFYFLLDTYLTKSRGYLWHALAGLLTAAAVLNKYTNLPILLVLVVICVLKLRRAKTDGTLRIELARTSLCVVVAALPIALWFARNQAAMGSFTGTSAFAAFLGWSRKPFLQWFDNPIFSFSGFADFWSDVLPGFWRGEFIWYGERVALKAFDVFYWLSSSAFILAFAINLFRRRSKKFDPLNFVAALSLFVFAMSVVMMIGMSLPYDFGRCMAPSRERPYFTAGRLISGTFIPFAAMYLGGLEIIFSSLKMRSLRSLALIVILAAIIIDEIVLSLSVFKSQFNWYHLVR